MTEERSPYGEPPEPLTDEELTAIETRLLKRRAAGNGSPQRHRGTETDRRIKRGMSN
jgi:hypothetical protein